MTLFEHHVYTGIGSRETPLKIRGLMTVLAYRLALDAWTLRSGCAPGADSAFEAGALAALEEPGVTRPELYLPWRGFEDREKVITLHEPQKEAYAIAKQYHPQWPDLSQGARKLHARNVHQILGPDVERPVLSTFVVCWTRDGKGAGGTGQALRIAKGYGIDEVYDLFHREAREEMAKFINPVAPI